MRAEECRFKGILLQRVGAPSKIRRAGWCKEVFCAYENVLEFIESAEKVAFEERIEDAVTDGSKIYVIEKSGISVIGDRKVERKDLLMVGEVKRAEYKEKKVYIHHGNEITIYRTDSKDIKTALRYSPFGSEIVSFASEGAKSESVLVVLVETHEQKLVRKIRVGNSLEEIGQYSVSKDSYRIFSAGAKKLVVLERSSLVVYEEEGKRSMCFGSPIVRAGCPGAQETITLCMLGNEICKVDLKKMSVVKTVAVEMVVEGIEKAKSRYVIWNGNGEIAILNEEMKVEMVRMAEGRVVDVRKERSNGREILHTLRYGRHGSVISKIDRKISLKKERSAHLETENDPLEVVGEEELWMVRYSNRTEIWRRAKMERTLPYAVCASVKNGTGYFVLGSGVTGAIRNGNIDAWCYKCAEAVGVDHAHAGGVLLGSVDDSGAVLVECGVEEKIAEPAERYSESSEVVKAVYVNSRKKQIREIEISEVISVDMNEEVAVINGLEKTLVLDRRSNALEETVANGRRVIPVGGGAYLINTYTGRVVLVQQGRKYRLRIGSVVFSGPVQCKGNVTVINTEKSVLIAKMESGRAEVAYVDKKSKGRFGLLSQTGYIRYKKGKSEIETGKIGPAVVCEEKRACPEEVVKCMPFGKYYVVCWMALRQITREGRVIPGTALRVSLHDKKSAGSYLEYPGHTAVELLKVRKHVAMGCNTEKGSALVLFEYAGKSLVQVDAKDMHDVKITNISKKGKKIYCSTTKGYRVFRVAKGKLEEEAGCPVPVETLCKAEHGLLMVRELPQVYVTDTRTKEEAVYTYRKKDREFAIGAMRRDLVLLGGSSRTGGFLAFLEKRSRFLEDVFDIQLPDRITHVLSGSTDLFTRAASAYLVLSSGSIFKASEISERSLERVLDGKRIAALSNSLFLLSTDAGVPSAAYTEGKRVDANIDLDSAAKSLVSLLESFVFIE